ncbi:MAG TPA: tRNA (adenosine(37)-N6)-threonylcarbamoyltransferase complex ATPase subunit type 1 TsaE [Candidatus Saccharimonadaceae bacterium]|nr:tRNA (adenosine(37)-N6)-threonylcarbamoyltransferase complex ATPase subunit type 1 TsaE [Candidatus Saccharimonadaceae bacterium]
MKKEVKSEVEMKALGARLGALLQGGEVIELSGDVGAGKTTFVKGLAVGMAIDEDVQSPSFTVSRVYDARDGLQLAHYDFYRLQDAGIMANELDEVIRDDTIVTVVEWADIVEGVLPKKRLRIEFASPSETDRTLEFSGLEKLTEQL